MSLDDELRDKEHIDSFTSQCNTESKISLDNYVREREQAVTRIEVKQALSDDIKVAYMHKNTASRDDKVY